LRFTFALAEAGPRPKKPPSFSDQGLRDGDAEDLRSSRRISRSRSDGVWSRRRK
jgi:hypothetical protein